MSKNQLTCKCSLHGKGVHYADGSLSRPNKFNKIDFFEEVIIFVVRMARSLRSLRQVATLRHGQMARRFAPAVRALGVCESIWPFSL